MRILIRRRGIGPLEVVCHGSVIRVRINEASYNIERVVQRTYVRSVTVYGLKSATFRSVIDFDRHSHFT